MRILIVEPYNGGSHRSFIDVVQKHSRHQVEALTLPARFWKWRLSGSPFVLAERFLGLGSPGDLLLFSNTIDVAAFVALAGLKAARLPRVIYFHENQITYPRSAYDVPDVHYGLINITSILACGEAWFNSGFHRRDFLQAVPPFLRQFPDFVPAELPERLNALCRVVGLPVDPLPVVEPARPRSSALRILWNHRWEYDKGPEDFFTALERLAAEGVDFEVVLLGEGFRTTPPVFDRARQALGERVLRYGFTESREEYASWVRACDVVVSCAQHEFFGISVAEAVLAGCHPLLPGRLVSPDFIPASRQHEHLYTDGRELVAKLRGCARRLDALRAAGRLDYYDDYAAPKAVARFDAEAERALEAHRARGL